ncbi:MAG: Toxin RelE [Wolbachia endosymbiont of Ctenocephalides felis wCfeF]|nr:type II toxin-antitoxin system RelE/ParE family toxin [Rickettsiales bacterium]WCR59574.1 MAG: Toxin RelE [Wolbachia endosymbiont of Ctenocephalides felis wCfeF]
MPALSPEITKSIIRAIDKRIATEPMKVGTPLLYEFKGHRRLQVSDYRIIYSVDIAEHEVTITSIKHRSESYNKKNKKKHEKKKPPPQGNKETKNKKV